jgi:hypothetical protein
MNGFSAETEVRTPREAAEFLDRAAREQYPESLYALGSAEFERRQLGRLRPKVVPPAKRRSCTAQHTRRRYVGRDSRIPRHCQRRHAAGFLVTRPHGFEWCVSFARGTAHGFPGVAERSLTPSTTDCRRRIQLASEGTAPAGEWVRLARTSGNHWMEVEISVFAAR